MHSPTKQKSHPTFLPLSPLIHRQTLRDPKAHSIDMSVNPKAGWFEGKLLMRHSSLEFLSLTWGKERKLKCVCIVFHLHTVLRYISHPQAASVKKGSELPKKKQINHYSKYMRKTQNNASLFWLWLKLCSTSWPDSDKGFEPQFPFQKHFSLYREKNYSFLHSIPNSLPPTASWQVIERKT